MRNPDQESMGSAGGGVVAARTTRRSLLEAVAGGALGAALAGTPALAAARQTPAAEPELPRVFPPHATRTASPFTEISFRGITADELGPVFVTGSHSGGHAGIMAPHADGNGVSYVPDSAFEPGERVTVRADVPLAQTGDGHLIFDVMRPAPLMGTRSGLKTDAPAVPPQELRTRPDLKPPVIEITTPAGATAEGLVFLAAKVEDGQFGLLVVDNDGEIVWYQPPAVSDWEHHDFRVQEYQGEPVLTWSTATTGGGYGQGHFVIADTAYETVAEVRAGNGFTSGGDVHEFLLTPEGTAFIMLYQGVDWDMTPAGGSMYGSVLDGIVQEIEVETGRVLFEWHALDHIGVEESYIAIPGSDPERPSDYVHMNAITIAPDGDLILSMRHTAAIYKVNPATGEIVWRLHGKRSDFEMGEGAGFNWQHDAHLHENGELSLFDNHEVNPPEGEEVWSRGIVLDLDMETMTASLVREYIHPERILAQSQANMQALPNANVFIGWGSAPDFSEFTHDGELIFNGRFPEGGNSYRAYRFPWSGQPIDPPDAIAETGADGVVTVYASWNGATEVASWRVLAGQDPTDLAEIGGAPRSGFETAIEIVTSAPWLAVEALDANGAILGASEAFEPGD
jgi:hypothetical protein